MAPGSEPLSPIQLPQKWNHEADVVIVGAGGAGLAAAVSAIENSAKVLVLEKNPFCGGNTSLAMVVEGLCGSRIQNKLGIQSPPLSERVNRDLTIPNATSGRNPTLVRQILEFQADTLNWLEDLGVVYEIKPAAGAPAPGIVHCPIDPEHPQQGWYSWFPHNARGFTEALEKQARNLGAKILLEHPVISLVVHKEKVVGVAAQLPNGKRVIIKGKSIILTSGGFGANKDMLKKYGNPRKVEGARYWGMPGSQGDGIRMAQALGAETNGMEEIEIWDGGALSEHGATTVYSTPNQLVRQKSLTVNKEGKRFFCESLYGGYYYSYQAAQTLSQKDQTSFTLFDADIIRKEDIIKKFDPMFCEYPCPWFEDQFQKYLKEGTIMKAGSIQELAKKMAVGAAVLVETVARYNQLCDKGVDEDFFKEPKYMQPIRKAPFYAVSQKGGACFNTWGGLIVDERFRVLNKNRNPIPGLYVAGENAAGGASLAYVLPGGRLAGKFAADEALKKEA
ncbi:MAG: FAD-dependent oxidoreductase [Desulfobacterales bacterium]|nr:FAD-dependent oxidoreductase [Desulfobacterales bacterium]